MTWHPSPSAGMYGHEINGDLLYGLDATVLQLFIFKTKDLVFKSSSFLIVVPTEFATLIGTALEVLISVLATCRCLLESSAGSTNTT